MSKYKCVICKCEYHYRINASKRDTKEYCHNCIIGRHHYAFRAACIDYKGGKCQICGYSKQRGLAFHHVDAKTKVSGVAAMSTNSTKRVKAELDKCILLCSNCHCEVHGDLELVRLGLPESELLSKIKDIHLSQRPEGEFRFTRKDWKSHHPLFVHYENPCE